jgi:DNA polymerase-3 subunit delta
MKTEIRAGKNPREVLKQHRVWDKRASLVNRCLERHSVSTLRDLQESLGTVDRMVKGIVQGDPWRELQNLLLALAGQETVRRVSSLP